MLQIERNYDFRRRIDAVHRKNRRDAAAKMQRDEIAIDETYAIAIPDVKDPVLLHAAEDLQDYFLQSMGLSLRIAPGGDTGIVLRTDAAEAGQDTFVITASAGKIVVSGNRARDVFNGTIAIEDILNLREAPFFPQGRIERKKLFTPRIVHSGWGIELFPDSHLNAIAHAGFDAVVVFVTAIDRTNVGVLDINDLIERAERHGLDTILYSYLPAYKDPAEANAQEFFEGVYSNLFRYYPKARGVMLVGESAEFPSRDKATTGKRYCESVIDGIPDTRPSPGWWPCEDYPDWLAMVAEAVHKVKPEALVIFNTYNWGWADEAVRRKFLERFPKDVVLQVTFEMFKEVKREDLTCAVMDYSISVTEPGFYFASECRIASELGIPLLATANTAGCTWDFGCVAHVPTPQQWMRKFRSLDEARQNWNLCRFYDNHHYGWEPSVVTDLGKEFFRSGRSEDMDGMLRKFAVRDFGTEAAPLVLEGWDLWSEAIKFFTPTNEDQYGPFRVGPSYPFIFHPNITRTMGNKEIMFPTREGAHFGYRIIKTFYQPYENVNQAPGSLRYPVELRSLNKLRDLWQRGLELMHRALGVTPERKQETLEFEINRGEFILRAINTGINMKNWYMLNIGLMNAPDKVTALGLLDKIEQLAADEMKNATEAIEFVERDSRLGWEPSMEYVTDKWHIEWKLRQMESMLREVADFRTIVKL